LSVRAWTLVLPLGLRAPADRAGCTGRFRGSRTSRLCGAKTLLAKLTHGARNNHTNEPPCKTERPQLVRRYDTPSRKTQSEAGRRERHLDSVLFCLYVGEAPLRFELRTSTVANREALSTGWCERYRHSKCTCPCAAVCAESRGWFAPSSMVCGVSCSCAPSGRRLAAQSHGCCDCPDKLPRGLPDPARRTTCSEPREHCREARRAMARLQPANHERAFYARTQTHSRARTHTEHTALERGVG
jgi:hypothetical protein